ncbi:MAG: creatininase family protein [Fimbriimonadaceae bacterium]|nr:creatininase family protein [Fimbriimonadaceae bacterium]
MREVRWERMFPDELEAACAACPGVYLPYGLCEPHGPQSALGLDALKAQGIAVRAAQLGGGIVAPPFFWHVHELGIYAVWASERIGEARPWLTGLPPALFFRNVLYHLRTMAALEFRAVILLTGHGGPHMADFRRVVELLQPYFAPRLAVVINEGNPGFPTDGMTGDHAGKVECSEMWYLDPACIDVSRLPPRGDDRGAPHFAMADHAYETSRRAGQHMVEGFARWLAAKLQELLAAYSASTPTRLSFAETEALWHDVIEPILPSLESMQQYRGPQGVPPASRWHHNWAPPPV